MTCIIKPKLGKKNILWTVAYIQLSFGRVFLVFRSKKKKVIILKILLRVKMFTRAYKFIIISP